MCGNPLLPVTQKAWFLQILTLLLNSAMKNKYNEGGTTYATTRIKREYLYNYYVIETGILESKCRWTDCSFIFQIKVNG